MSKPLRVLRWTFRKYWHDDYNGHEFHAGATLALARLSKTISPIVFWYGDFQFVPERGNYSATMSGLEP